MKSVCVLTVSTINKKPRSINSYAFTSQSGAIAKSVELIATNRYLENKEAVHGLKDETLITFRFDPLDMYNEQIAWMRLETLEIKE